MNFLAFVWYAIVIVQSFFSYGTAYRYTKRGGDNGISLFGWLLALGFASLIPGLGFYLWHKNRDIPFEKADSGRNHHVSRTLENQNNAYKKTCMGCNTDYDPALTSCPACGKTGWFRS